MWPKNTWRACFSLFRIRLAQGLQYRAAALAGAATSIFWGIVEISILWVFFTYGGQGDRINGMSFAQAASYCWLAQFLVALAPMSIDRELLSKINTGDVALELCRPLDLYWHWYAKICAGRVTECLLRGLLCLVAGALLPGMLHLGPPASLMGLLLFGAAVLNALMLCVAYAMLATALRLSIHLGEGPTYMVLLLGGLLSGSYLPLQLWPDFMQRFLLLQPFAGYLDIPARLYIGTLLPAQALPTLALQWGWTACFMAMGRIMLHRKLKTIAVQGG